MNKYIVTADKPDQSILKFAIEQPGYRDAWVQGRKVCKLGGKVDQVTDPKTNKTKVLNIGPAEWTVRKVFAVEGRRNAGRPKSLTADVLVAAAQKAGIKVPGKLTALMNRLAGKTA